MTQVETLSAAQAASNYVLSPDAEVFIPQQYKAAAAPVLIPKDAPIIPQPFPTLADGGSKHPNRMGSNYTTPLIHADTCAVLPNGDVGAWQVPGRVIGGKNYSGKGSNRGGKFNGSRHPVRRQIEEPFYGVPMPAPHPTMLFNRVDYPAAALAADGSNYVYVQYPAAAPPGYNFNPPPPPPPPPPLPPTQAAIHGAPPRGHPAASTAPAAPYGIDPTLMSTGYLPTAPTNVYAANTQNYEEWPEMKQTKPPPPQQHPTTNQKTPSNNKVNIGIQKEPSRSGANNNVKSGIQQKAVYEVAVQTDFSEEVSNLTLSEKPSCLFGSKKRIRNHSNQWISNLTDSEEKDSDSGYSSPLHRRNLVSNGTHAAPDRLVSCAETAAPLAQPVGFSYAAIAQRPAKAVPRFVTSPNVSSTKTAGQDQAASEEGKNLDSKPGEENGKKKRKRNRRKKKKDGDKGGGNLSSPGQTQGSSLSNSVSMDDMVLHYEDEEEFPELSSTTIRKEQTISTPRMNYCDMLKNNSVIYQTPSQEDGDLDENDANNKKDGRITRRWQKRQEIANRAAEEELAEITLEQQMLMQRNIPMKKSTSAGSATAATTSTTSSTKPPLNTGATPGLLSVNPSKPSAPATPGKKSKQPFALDIRAMIDALEKRQEDTAVKEVPKEKGFTTRPLSGNTLDANAPAKRGKEREQPKTKKPSPLKKVILKEREEKKRLRLLEVDPTGSALDNDLDTQSVPVGLGVVNAESDLSQDAASVKGEHGGAMTPASADLSPVSQTSPISISPLSSGVNSPITGATEKDVNPAVLKIHSRRFREYCNQILDKDIDACCTTLLRDLVSFQDRLYHKDPVKAKMRRRIVLGLREVTKHLKLKKLKCVIISPNLEKIQSKGGLDDALNNILNLCTDQNVPFVFALGRRALGRACAKLVPVSVVGIFNYEGSEENFQKLMELTEKARQSYVEMVAMIEKDIQENIPQIYSNTAQIFAHMGHSRTPSGCSGISFASSILSEPISENYPQSEPETDSRGNEIAKREIAGRESEMKISPLCLNQVCVSSMMGDIDDGNEADTEDCNDPSTSVQANDSIDNVNLESLSSADVDREDSADDEDDIGSGNNAMFQEALGELPHIDSIHSATYELNTEILSQHSVRTIGDTSEVMSTHSSKTIGEGSSTIVTDTYSEQGQLDKTSNCVESSINLTRVKTVEKDKLIQDWVKASQTCIDEDGESSEQETAKEEEEDEEEEDEEEEEEDSCASSCGSNKDLVVFPALSSSPVAMALAPGVKTSPLPVAANSLESSDVSPSVGNGVQSVTSATTDTMTLPSNTPVTTAVSFQLSS